MESTEQRGLRTKVPLVVLLALSVGANLMLTFRLTHNGGQQLTEGRGLTGNMAPLRLMSTRGQVIDIVYRTGELQALFYFFSPECPWCETNQANFEALIAESPRKYRFYAISSAPLGELRAYAQRKQIDVPLYHILPESVSAYGFVGTPSTLLVSPTGSVLARWEGAYNPSTTLEMERMLSVHLPGLTFAPPEEARAK